MSTQNRFHLGSFSLASRRSLHRSKGREQRMVCPCGVGGVALFALPAAFAKFNALPAPKKKAAALVLLPLVLALAAWCAPATNQPSQHTVVPQPFHAA